MIEPINTLKKKIKDAFLPSLARSEKKQDSQGLPQKVPEINQSLSAAINWLCRAQDKSSSRDGGVARHFSLVDGWSPSYPETTGYIIPTIVEWGKLKRDQQVFARGKKMLDWLVSIQFPEGGFPGGVIHSSPVVPVTFNTGQILFGLACGTKEFDEPAYQRAMVKSANWLVETIDQDGCWRKFSSPFAQPGDKVYDTHVAWGLLEAARVHEEKSYEEAALNNLYWALGHQLENGWFRNCCLTNSEFPLTHTLGYALRGILEGFLYFNDQELLRASEKTARGLMSIIDPSGFLPGRIDKNWHGVTSWACLTGSVQIASCLFLLYRHTQDTQYRDMGVLLNQYARRTMSLNTGLEWFGGVKGSFPCDGEYGTYQFLNWAGKFFVDSHLLELNLTEKVG